MLSYLREIKNRMVLIAVCSFFSFFVCYFYKKVLLLLLINVYKSSFIEYNPFNFMLTDITEMLFVYLRLVMFLSNQITYIYFFYHSLIFLMPAFYYSEYRYLKIISAYFLSAWVTSALVLNYLVIPLSWSFFYNFQNSQQSEFILFHFEAKVSDFVSFYTYFYYFCLYYFQSFIVLAFIFSIINNKIFYIKQSRKLYYYIFFVFSVFVSPPDVFTQLFLCFLATASYEFLLITQIFKIRIKTT